jgi:hypothetical protein
MLKRSHLNRSLAVGLAIGVAALPASAQASFMAAGGGGSSPTLTGAVLHRVGPVDQGGFNWADAGIGAGGAIVIVVAAGAAGATAVRRHRLPGVA